MQRFILMITLALSLASGALAYKGFRFNSNGKFPTCIRISMGTGDMDGCKGLAQDLGYDLSTMKEVVVVVDGDATKYVDIYGYVCESLDLSTTGK